MWCLPSDLNAKVMKEQALVSGGTNFDSVKETNVVIKELTRIGGLTRF